jgi:Protein of unknown function (DUF3027)
MTSTPEAAPTPETAPTPEGDADRTPAADPTVGASETPEVSPAPAPIDEIAARELALAALHEITPATTVGEPTDSSVDADGVLTVRYENRMPGYPGWFWTVSLAQVDGSAPTVLEAELMPGDGALTAPDWLPWAERLAEYQAAQAALAAEGLATDDLVIVEDEDEDEDLDDVDDLDAVDFDRDGSPILHSGDVDGVDIDELSDDAGDLDESEEDSDDEDSDDEDSDDQDSDDEDSDDEDSDEEDSDDEDEPES